MSVKCNHQDRFQWQVVGNESLSSIEEGVLIDHVGEY